MSMYEQTFDDPKAPLLFLDIDGVLVTHESMQLFESAYRFDPACVAQLNRVVAATGCCVVVSSTWRKRFRNVGQLDTLLDVGGVDCWVVGYTPSSAAGYRGGEISAWLEKHGQQHRRFAVVDDDGDMDGVRHRFVQTNMAGGLTAAHADRLIALLS